MKAQNKPEWHEKKIPLAKLKPFERNPRKISALAYQKLKESLESAGYHQRILATPDFRIIGGHQRIKALKELGYSDVIVLVPDRTLSDDEFRKLLIQDNLPWGEFDMEMVMMDYTQDELVDFGMPDSWFPADPEAAKQKTGAGSLSEKFMIPPFSVFNAREGWWQRRKQAWIDLGIDSELGRGENLLRMSPQASLPKRKKTQDKAPKGKVAAGLTFGAVGNYDGAAREITGTSVFDPVLCEIAYRWFCPPKGLILDPFAGGSVRGIVASRLGRQYLGVDLRKEQVEANIAQGKEICRSPMPKWVAQDSRHLDKLGVEADFIFTCPPYADLEVYSDDPRDISTMKYPEFRAAYREIIKHACDKLKDDRFACVVVGEVRDKKGNYYDFVGDTVQAFRDAGLSFYNEGILVTAIGSLPVRVGRQFSDARKFGKTHQNILVFLKGDAKLATKACGTIEVVDLAASLGVEEA